MGIPIESSSRLTGITAIFSFSSIDTITFLLGLCQTAKEPF